MAIKLEVQSYCENCLVFDADVERPTKLYGGDMPLYQTDTVIRCSYRKCCAMLIKYLAEESRKGETKKMNWKIVHNKDHYNVYINGKFYCSADTFEEAVKELEEYETIHSD